MVAKMDSPDAMGLAMDKLPYEEYVKKLFDPQHNFDKPEALKGIRWISATMYIFTPHSVANLAELGAEVVKIETPRMGDPMRHTSPFNEAYLYPLHDTRPTTGTGFGFMNANSNKYFVSLDYHQKEAKGIMHDLIRQSDGLTECYRPATFEKWGIAYRQAAEINPRFIYVWGGGFGIGPKIFGGSYDILGQAQGGVAGLTGFHEDLGGYPAKATNRIIEWNTGNQISVGIMAALYWRRKTGIGTMIEFSQVHAATRYTGYGLPLYQRFGIVRQRWGNWDTQLSVHGIIRTGKSDFPKDTNPQLREDARYVMVSAFHDADFKELCDLIGRHELWEKYKEHKARLKPEAQIEIYAALEKWAEDKTRSEAVSAIGDKGLLVMPVMNDKEVYESEHYRERGSIRWIDDPLYGDVLVQSGYSTGMLSDTPRRTKWIWRPVGADNVKVLHEMLGYPMSQIKEWYDKGVI